MVLRLCVCKITWHLVKNAGPIESYSLRLVWSPEDEFLTSTPGDPNAFGDMHGGNMGWQLRFTSGVNLN